MTKTPAPVPGCAGRVHETRWGMRACMANGKFTHTDGKCYCHLHYPPNVKQREADRRAKWDAERKARLERHQHDYETRTAAEAHATACLALVDRVARLNPDAGEIGDGMLVQLVTEARRLRPDAGWFVPTPKVPT